MSSDYRKQNIVLFNAEKTKSAKLIEEITELSIELNPTTIASLKGTFQEKIYLQQIKTLGSPLVYQLQYNDKTTQCYLTSPTGEIIQGSDMFPVYAFVILETELGLDLRLGNTNHYFVSNCAPKVKAAGDIYFSDAKIIKITDQSGGYNICCRDPNARSKRAAARVAMQSVGLPMDKFQPFIVEAHLEKSSEVLFSAGPYRRHQQKRRKHQTLAPLDFGK